MKRIVLLIAILFSYNSASLADGVSEKNQDVSFYTGTFDTIDKEGDDQTTLFGFEHKNSDLFRNTFLGKFSPVTGVFITKKDSVFLYTGIEGQYGLGNILTGPSFTPFS